METEKWEVLDETNIRAQADLLCGLLKAQGIPAYVSQEGLGEFGYRVAVGDLGRAQILVPSSALEHARQVLEAYYKGEFESEEDPESES